jgi:hypothetical protein
MAESPAHRFGQIIGEVLEAAVEPILAAFAQEHGLYLDKKGPRSTRPGRKKVSWQDRFGNSHDLDFVLERGGSDTVNGTPVAFVETAWRSYTRHSKNKAQEIQGAILPVAEKHHLAAPFTGVVLAGMFTEGSLKQLESHGFPILFFTVEEVVGAFDEEGLDARFNKATPDEAMAQKVLAWDLLPDERRRNIAAALTGASAEKVSAFVQKLTASVTRQVVDVVVLPLHGSPEKLASIGAALDYVSSYNEDGARKPFSKYHIIIRFETGNRVEADFVDRESAVAFLGMYEPVLKPVVLE